MNKTLAVSTVIKATSNILVLQGKVTLAEGHCSYHAGQAIGFDGLNNPEIVGQDAGISFKTAVWFWMLNSNCHQGITSGSGFGSTIRAINSGECGGGNSGAVQSRVGFYQRFCGQFGVDPGQNIDC
ncbi:Chitinase 8 [Nymphaea thermarum]|nr:Chitinase 8 [Nymphaea thermarum]